MSASLKKARGIFEQRYLQEQVNRFDNNILKISSFVGMERSALHRKLTLLKLNRPKGLSKFAQDKCYIAETLYKGGMTIRQITKQLNISQQTLYAYLRHRDVPLGKAVKLDEQVNSALV